jgi:acetyltransferase
MATRLSSDPFPPESTVLRDGSRLTLRAIRPDDAPRLQAGMARLSPETIFRRFMAPLRGLTEAEAQHLACVDYDRRMALVATREPEGYDEIVGVARYDATNTADSAEVAIVVADAYQGRGLGVLLIKRLAAYARAHSISRFSAVLLQGNESALRLITAAGLWAESCEQDHGERRVSVALRRPRRRRPVG